MDIQNKIRKISIPPVSFKLCTQLLNENPILKSIISGSKTSEEAHDKLMKMVVDWFEDGHENAFKIAQHKNTSSADILALEWQEIAAIRIYDYLVNTGKEYENLNKRIKVSVNNPFTIVWLAWHERKGGGRPAFFYDMIHLFRQFSGHDRRDIPPVAKVEQWMSRFPAGTEAPMVSNRRKNRDRIISILKKQIDGRDTGSHKYTFKEGMNDDEKIDMVREWWNDYKFHLHFAIRTPDLLNELLEYSLDTDTVDLLRKARKAGIPFFVNPYYLSLLNVNNEEPVRYADQTIREYVIYSKELIDEYGRIEAWEREDEVVPGVANAAGWFLPNDTNIHRRYPEVAILIPDTMGRACGGLCVSCQRMYDFQRGHLNFNLDKLKPAERWEEKLGSLMNYFEDDTQLRDILITGGDALMSSDRSLKVILDAVHDMSERKREANKKRAQGDKKAEMLRVRLGTRLPVYLPQRITDKLVAILTEFREKATKIGIRQFIIQTHFITPAEVTPEAVEAVKRLRGAGWIVTNQAVFTAAGSRRGHTAKLRKTLNDIGVLNYYTFTVKGYMENYRNFSTNGRIMQEMIEEKYIGSIPAEYKSQIDERLLDDDKPVVERINTIRKDFNLPFLATDRNIVNLPGIGKSLSFRVVGLTRRGRRILEFGYDTARKHSPAVNESERVYIIESKPVKRYIEQVENMGEDAEEYNSIWGYSMGVTEERIKFFEYPSYDFDVTKEFTNVG